MSTIDVSIIICTRNRAYSLSKTLVALKDVQIPESRRVELIVIDNNSTDETTQVVKNARLPYPVHYHCETRRGLSNARNTGLAIARGEAILFTDDDVIPSSDWFMLMTSPLLKNECDAITGKVTLAAHLHRPWLGDMHRVWMAVPNSTGASSQCTELIGANMGFRRNVLSRVPFFDPQLGAGALGFMEETLFSYQLHSAGFRLKGMAVESMVHHLDTSRLLRREWLKSAYQRGASLAYVLHHWNHAEIQNSRIKSLYLHAKLNARRRLQPPCALNEEGCPEWEMSYLTEIHKLNSFRSEQKVARKYEKHGLCKLPE